MNKACVLPLSLGPLGKHVKYYGYSSTVAWMRMGCGFLTPWAQPDRKSHNSQATPTGKALKSHSLHVEAATSNFWCMYQLPEHVKWDKNKYAGICNNRTASQCLQSSGVAPDKNNNSELNRNVQKII